MLYAAATASSTDPETVTSTFPSTSSIAVAPASA